MDRYKITLHMEFEGSEEIPSLVAAEDWAYTVTDKGDYTIILEE